MKGLWIHEDQPVAILVFEDGTWVDFWCEEDGSVDISSESGLFTADDCMSFRDKPISEFLANECKPASQEVIEKFWRDYVASKL